MKIHPEAQRIIEHYKNIKVSESRTIRCPYFRNPQSGRERWGLLVFSGKSSPQEIEQELRIIEKLESKDFSRLNDQEIDSIMRKRKLGIDCSGFIAQVLDAWSRAVAGKPIHKFIKFPQKGLGWFYTRLRPLSHLNIATFIHPANAEELSVEKQKIQPGDLIVFRKPLYHAAIITAVGESVEYAYAAIEDVNNRARLSMGEAAGVVKEGKIENGQWSELPQTGRTILDNREPPKFYRLKCVNQWI